MKKFGILSAMLALGSLSLAAAVPTLPPMPVKDKAPAKSEPLAPKMVKLNLKDVSVVDAVAELARQSGYSIVITGDTAPAANRKITLQTGEVTFFEALDQLCLKGGLVDRMPVNGINPQAVPIPKIRPVQPKIQPAPQPGAQAPQALPKLQVVQQVQLAQLPVRYPIGTVQLFEGKPLQVPTCYAGAVRIRILPQGTINVAAQPGETNLIMEVTAEPRVQSFNVLQQPAILKAIDDLGQALTVPVAAAPVRIVPKKPGAIQPNPVVPANPPVPAPVVPPAPPVPPAVVPPAPPVPAPAPAPAPAPQFKLQPAPAVAQPAIAQPMIRYANAMQRIVIVRLKLGEKQATTLKELTGTLNVRCMSEPQTVAAIKNVLQAKGQMAKSQDNRVTMILDNIEKVGTAYRAQITVEQQLNQPQVQPAPVPVPLPPAVPGGAKLPKAAVQQAAVAFPPLPTSIVLNAGLPSLVDAQGKTYQAAIMSSQYQRVMNGVTRRVYTIQYTPLAGQGEPSSLVLNQTSLVTVPVSFTLKDVPLR